MPIVKPAINGFTAFQVHRITGLSQPMIEYLRRMNYLQPFYNTAIPTRGKVRYYSYRDLVIARIIQRLRETGVELSRLKEAMISLRDDKTWLQDGALPDVSGPLKWLISDGKTVWQRGHDGFLKDLRPGGQRAFAFIVNMEGVTAEVKKNLSRRQRKDFSMENRKLRFEDEVANGRRSHLTRSKASLRRKHVAG
jgi:DNA-binding transcriptional MerR regulator